MVESICFTLFISVTMTSCVHVVCPMSIHLLCLLYGHEADPNVRMTPNKHYKNQYLSKIKLAQLEHTSVKFG